MYEAGDMQKNMEQQVILFHCLGKLKIGPHRHCTPAHTVVYLTCLCGRHLEILLVRVRRDPEAGRGHPTCLGQGQGRVPRHQVRPLWPGHRFACAVLCLSNTMGTNMTRAH